MVNSPEVVVHMYKPSTQEAEARVQSQPGLQSKIPSKTNKQTHKNTKAQERGLSG